jgi:hypothetical protein
VNALDLTTRDLIRALSRLTARPALDGAVRGRAEAVAKRIEATGGNLTVDVVRRGEGAYVVAVSGPDLFAREFGSVDHAPEPIVGPAVAAESAP